MVTCERCNSELPDDAVFCTRCGRRAVSSWATVKAPEETTPAQGSRQSADDTPTVAASNVFSTAAVFLGVVALLNLMVGVAGVALASIASFRREPSSRFALAVTGVGIALSAVLRVLVFDNVQN